MTKGIARRAATATALVALALPSGAAAHSFGHSYRAIASGQACRAIQAGRTPYGLTSTQVSALASACNTRSTAVAAAHHAYRTATQPARDELRATVRAVSSDWRAALAARRAACETGWWSQTCVDARSTYRTTVGNLRDRMRSAYRSYRTAVAPPLSTYRAAVRSARQAFHQQVEQILHPQA